ncbi:hypothetical protein CEP54_009141 [Fusarium duplospermum]|uniref:Uncharacterized protein n=1 Tax=Fusarium duplospermum TaxID=1325734 RepID=A0A428PS45_9HYPO|nr:hypothetical protein CEP54_009141 [Fusarium duplospermum]
MSDNIDPREAQKRLIAMADLNRLRQEELPLSTEEKRGPSFNPTGRNGTDHINPSRKQGLSNKWTVKIDDEEARQTDGLEIENARPWGKKMAERYLAASGYNGGLPPTIPKRGRGDDDTDSFPPTKKSEQRPSVTVARWGPQNTTPAPEQPVVASQEIEAVNSQVQHESNGNGNAPEASVAVPEVSVTAPVSTNLEFVLNTTALDPAMAEHIIGTGQCQAVPGKDEALSFTAEVVMKLLISENRAVLELSAPGKSHRVLDALELSSPVIDGQFCVFTQLSNGAVFYFRFANDTETKKFKRHLVKMQKSARAHQPQENAGEGGQQQAIENQVTEHQVTEHQVTEHQVTEHQVTEHQVQQQADSMNQSAVSLAILDEDLQPLIAMDGWSHGNNFQSLNLENATKHVVVLVNRMLGSITLREDIFDSALEGIEDGIIEHWVQNGFFRGCNDSLKDKFCDMVRSMVRFQIGFLRRESEGFGENDQGVQQATQGVRDLTLADAPPASPQAMPRESIPAAVPQQRAVSHQQDRSASASLLGTQLEGRQGLSASRYASGPVEFMNCFTGPRILREE